MFLPDEFFIGIRPIPDLTLSDRLIILLAGNPTIVFGSISVISLFKSITILEI